MIQHVNIQFCDILGDIMGGSLVTPYHQVDVGCHIFGFCKYRGSFWHMKVAVLDNGIVHLDSCTTKIMVARLDFSMYRVNGSLVSSFKYY